MSQADDNAKTGQPPASGRNAIWPRIAYSIGFGIVAYAVVWLVFALAILQLIVTGVSGERNEQLTAFGAKLGSYLREITRYLLASSDAIPFPFGPFPAE